MGASTVPPATEDIGQAAIDYNISVVRDTQMQIEEQARAKAEAEAQQDPEFMPISQVMPGMKGIAKTV